MEHLACNFFTHVPIYVRYSIIKMQTRSSSEGFLQRLTGEFFFQTLVLTLICRF